MAKLVILVCSIFGSFFRRKILMKVVLRKAQATAIARDHARGNLGPLMYWFSNHVPQVLW